MQGRLHKYISFWGQELKVPSAALPHTCIGYKLLPLISLPGADYQDNAKSVINDKKLVTTAVGKLFQNQYTIGRKELCMQHM